MAKEGRREMKIITAFAISALLLIGQSCSAGIVNSTSYLCSELLVSVPAGAFMGGFDVLPGGNYVINDGAAVREITQSGDDVRALYTYDSPVFASFVRHNNGLVYFADTDYNSSMIRCVDLDGGAATDIARLDWNYDIDFYDNQAYVVAGDSVYMINPENTTVKKATAPGYSGPVALDSAGNLYYSPSNYPFTTAIYKWNADKLQSGTTLQIADADASISVGGAAGIVFDNMGRLIFSNNFGGQAIIQRWDGASIETLGVFALEDVESPAITLLRYDPATNDLYAAVNYYTDGYANNYSYIAKLEYVPEPGSFVGLCWLATLAGCGRMLRRRK